MVIYNYYCYHYVKTILASKQDGNQIYAVFTKCSHYKPLDQVTFTDKIEKLLKMYAKGTLIP